MMNSEKTAVAFETKYITPKEQKKLHYIITNLYHQVKEKHKLLNEALALNAELQKWKAAVEDALVIDGISNASHADPRKAVLDLQLWERQVALDPAVSAEAVKLQEAVAEACAKMCDEYGSKNPQFQATVIERMTADDIAACLRAGKWRTHL